ncbi:MAG: hypothetical protein ACPKPY_05465 [Nitrososphaeraceae archaeon]
MNNENIILSGEYNYASSNFRDAWTRGIEAAKDATIAMTNMVTALIQNGYKKPEAIKQIIGDHKDLKGFSQASVYRHLPPEFKRDYNSKLKKSSKFSQDDRNENERKQEDNYNENIASKPTVYEPSNENDKLSKTESIRNINSNQNNFNESESDIEYEKLRLRYENITNNNKQQIDSLETKVEELTQDKITLEKEIKYLKSLLQPWSDDTILDIGLHEELPIHIWNNPYTPKDYKLSVKDSHIEKLQRVINQR